MQCPRKLKVTDLNPHLICVLCGGYYVDATTIIECLHSFCKSCIVRYLETNKYCPICDVQVHKTRPLQNIRPDITLQNIVYKLVPGLYQNEMRCRREFYAKHPEAKQLVQNPEARGELTDQSSIFLPEDPVSICLEYLGATDGQQGQSSHGRRYLRCPAAVSVCHLHKLIKAKFGLSMGQRVDIFYKDELLCENWTLMDVAYIYQWRRKSPIHLMYRILESQRKRIKFSHESTQPSLAETNLCKAPGKDREIAAECQTEQSAVSTEIPEKKTPVVEWKEVQLQISENGVMKVTGVENTSQLLAPPQKIKVEGDGSKLIKEMVIENKKGVEKTENLVKNKETVVGGTPSSSSSLENNVSNVDKKISDKSEQCEKRTKEVFQPVVLQVPASTNSELPPVQSEAVDNSKTPKDNNNVGSIKSANKIINYKLPNNSERMTNSPVKNKIDRPEDTVKCVPVKSEPHPTTGLVNSSVNPSAQPVSHASKEDTTVRSNLNNSNPGDMISASSPRPMTTSHKVYPGVKSSIPYPKEEHPKLNSVKIATSSTSSPMSSPKLTPMEILNASVKKLPNPPTGRYKTLKTPTKTWNPSIPRAAILSMKQAQAAANQSKEGNSSGGNDGTNPPPAKQPRFFKLRNMPRFLGNPSSGVKPMYQVAPGSEIVSQTPLTSSAPTTTTTTTAATTTTTTVSLHKSMKPSSVTLMKIDPKTLSPIPVNPPVTHVLNNPPRSTSSPQPKKLPPPFTPGSPKHTNHYTNCRTAHSNPTNSKTSVPRIPSPAHSGGLIPTNPFLPSVAHTNPHLLYNAFPGPFAPTDPSGNRLLPGPNSELIRAMTALCSPGSAFHPSLPPSISMLFNPHHPHHRLTPAQPEKLAPAVQRIPPSNVPNSKSMPPDNSHQNLNSSSPAVSQTNLTKLKKEKMELSSPLPSPNLLKASPQPKKPVFENHNQQNSCKADGQNVASDPVQPVAESKQNNNNNNIPLSQVQNPKTNDTKETAAYVKCERLSGKKESADKAAAMKANGKTFVDRVDNDIKLNKDSQSAGNKREGSEVLKAKEETIIPNNNNCTKLATNISESSNVNRVIKSENT